MVSSNDDGHNLGRCVNRADQSRTSCLGQRNSTHLKVLYCFIEEQAEVNESTYVSETGTLADIKYSDLTVANATDLKYMEVGDVVQTTTQVGGEISASTPVNRCNALCSDLMEL